MKREDFKELCELSEKVLGHKYAWKKLRSKGLVSELVRVGRGFTARRMPLSVAGVKQYLTMTLQMQEKIKQELEAKNNEQV